MKASKWALIGGTAFAILVNSLAIFKGYLFVPFLFAAVVLIYLMVFRFDLLVYLMAFSTPFSILLQNDKVNLGLSMPTEVIMIAVTFLFFFRACYDIALNRKILRHPITLSIIAYLTWMFITCLTSEIPLVSFKFLASKIWFITSSYFVVTYLIENDLSKWVRFFNCYAVALTTVVIITTIKYAAYGFQGHIAHWIMNPYYNDHTAYGAILALFIPITTAFVFLPQTTKRQRIGYVFMLCVFLMGFFFSYSRAAWLSLIGAIGVWCVLKLRIKLSWIVLAAAVLGSGFYFFADDILYKMSRNSQDSSGNLVEHLQSMTNISTDASNVERLNRWNSAFRMIEERPVMGWGPGCYQFCYAPYQDYRYLTIISTNFGDGGNAHSEYIGPTAETGFVGLFTVLAMMVIVIYYGIITYIRSKNKTARILSLGATLSLITYYIHGVLNNFLDTDKLSLPFWGLFALIVVANALYMREEAANQEG